MIQELIQDQEATNLWQSLGNTENMKHSTTHFGSGKYDAFDGGRSGTHVCAMVTLLQLISTKSS
jgi:hypothetical protein